MPTAKLLKPRSLQVGGVVYLKNVVTPVDEATARSLDEDDRFVVEGLDGHSGKAKSAALQTKSDATKIREAADQLDPDVESHFTADGRPSAEAVSKALGKEVTQHQVDVALGLGGKGRVVIKDPPKPAAPDKAKIVKIKSPPPKKPDPAKETETKTPTPGAGAAATKDGVDPTTDGAIS